VQKQTKKKKGLSLTPEKKKLLKVCTSYTNESYLFRRWSHALAASADLD